MMDVNLHTLKELEETVRLTDIVANYGSRYLSSVS
jgi:hypothetical protein